MKKLISSLFLLILTIELCQAQNTSIIFQSKEDSILKIISTKKEASDICKEYLAIAWLYAGQNLDKENEYFNKTIFTAEQTRDKKLIATSYTNIANQWLGIGSLLERQNNALIAIDKGLAVSKQAQLNEESAFLYVKKAYTNRVRGNLNEAVKLNEEAVNYAELTDNDSLKIAAQLSYGNTLIAKDDNFSAFKKYMLALNMSEVSNKKELRLTLHERLGNFHKKIGQIERAKDYYIEGIKLAKEINDSSLTLTIYSSLINLYAGEKDYAMAREYLKILYKKGETNERYLQYAIGAESGIIAKEDINKLPEFIKKNPMLLTEYAKYNMFFEMYRLKGIIFSVEKKFDSALYYLTLAKKEFNPNDINSQANWNESFAYYLEKKENYNEAATYMEQNVILAKQIQSLTNEKECYENLDSLYIKGGNKAKEITNKSLLYKIKDSLDKQQKAYELLGVEVDIENKRTERENNLKKERHNLQYMGILAAIIALFIALAAMGKFKVKPWLIRSLGFVSFILLFEFIILLIDHKLHELTHGEPLPILLVKIVLIAMLLPFHHWLEHKVIHYLVKHEHENKIEVR
jgi:tetratricopeptide (TPR) repeat protein